LILANRLCKAAMTEGIASGGAPTPQHVELYRQWAQSGVGLHITGNVQVDRLHLERPGNVVLDRPLTADQREPFRRWAAAVHEGGSRIFMQISHAGRQTPSLINPTPLAPSAVPLNLPGKLYGSPRAMSEAEILDVIARFARAAETAQQAGFDGVQLHAAHGYLISQFLSPLANARNDAWGGPLENRARFLLESVKAVRSTVGLDFAVSVKLNSSDFQKGGFSPGDSLRVIGWLKELGVDLLELSGGSYERPAMLAPDLRPAASTRAREAYFIDFAEQALKASSPPLMVTGGFRSVGAMNDALAEGVSIVGLGRPLCVATAQTAALLAGRGQALPRVEDELRLGPGFLSPQSRAKMIRQLNTVAAQAWYYQQIRRLARGQRVDPGRKVVRAFLAEQRDNRRTDEQNAWT
jgi:2,4-dienoyl-CoA reductase-like NADH-dependent reductase (Old Yellow Enzyme family)